MILDNQVFGVQIISQYPNILLPQIQLAGFGTPAIFVAVFNGAFGNSS
jgi:hypothetical protein